MTASRPGSGRRRSSPTPADAPPAAASAPTACPGPRSGVVDHRHVIHALRRKPQAFARLVHRDGLLPREECAQAWARLSEARSQKDACRRMVGLLALAHDEGCEAELAHLIPEGLGADRTSDARGLRARLEPRGRGLPADVPVALTAFASFDSLLGAHA